MDRLNPADLPKDTKNFFVKESVNRRLPGTQKAVGSEFPERQIVGGNVDGPYKSPVGIRMVGSGGIGFRAETPGLV